MRQQKITTVMLEPYMDQALTPVVDDETETLEMFTHNEGARGEVKHQRKIAALIGHALTQPHSARLNQRSELH